MTNRGGIVRTKKDKDHPYKTINTLFATDQRLTFEARGLMVYLLSKPDDWQVQVNDLIKQSPAGRDKVYSLLQELERYGYIERTQERLEGGKIGPITYTVFEVAQPIADTNSPLTALPYTAQPDTVSPDTDQPYTAKPELNKYREVQNKESTKNGKRGSRATADAADAPAEQSDDYRQPTAPEQPSPIADKLHSRQVAPHQSIIDAYAAELGYKLRSGGKEAGAAKWLANNEYTPEQVVSCYRSLKSDPWWTDKHLSLQTIANQIGAWITKGASSRRNGHGPKPVPAQPRYAEPDVKPRATLKDLEKQR